MAGLVIASLVAIFWPLRSPERLVPRAGIDAVDGSSGGTAATVSVEPRQIFRHSVIPGGLVAPEEVGWAMKRDPVVAAHYARVRLGAVRVAYLGAPQTAYMSYRIGDRIYWTRAKLQLREGERVLTDGETMIRGRCGNLVSLVPMVPMADAEPPALEFDGLGDPSVMAALPPLEADPVAAGGVSDKLGDTGVTAALPPLEADPVTAGGVSDAARSESDRALFRSGLDRGPQPGRFILRSAPVGRVTRGVPTGESEPMTNPGPLRWNPETEAPLPVPEPTTLVLISLGAAGGIARYLRDRRRQRQPPQRSKVRP